MKNIMLNENKIRKIINESIKYVLMEKAYSNSEYSASINIADKYWDKFFDTIDYDTNESECDNFVAYCDKMPHLFDVNISVEEQNEMDDYGSPLGQHNYTTRQMQGIDDEFDTIYDYIQDYPTDDEDFKQTALHVLEDVMYKLDVSDF